MHGQLRHEVGGTQVPAFDVTLKWLGDLGDRISKQRIGEAGWGKLNLIVHFHT